MKNVGNSKNEDKYKELFLIFNLFKMLKLDSLSLKSTSTALWLVLVSNL